MNLTKLYLFFIFFYSFIQQVLPHRGSPSTQSLERRQELENSSEEYRTTTAAAALIQKVYRNFRRKQNEGKVAEENRRMDAAQIIQTTYRIYATKKFCIEIARELLCGGLLQQWFDAHAIVIQKTFRGYSVRKNTLNYYKFKEWLKFVGEFVS